MKVHILCNSPKTLTGFAKVGIHIAEGLQKLGHEISMTGFQTIYESEYTKSGIEVMPINVQYTDELSQYKYNIQKSGADIALNIFNADDYEQNRFAKAVKPSVWYTPVEGSNICDRMSGDLKFVSENGKIIAQCFWGQNEMKKVGIESQVIYHGYDPLIFKKLNNSKPDKEIENEKINVFRYLEDFNTGKWQWYEIPILLSEIKKFLVLNGKFVFGFVGANHGIRKRIERLLRAYSLFLKNNKQLKDRTVLIMRTLPISITSPLILNNICDRLEISENVIFLYGEYNRLSEEAMNYIYNLFDVNVSASSSEGFGMSCLESMASVIPQIGPACSSFIELIGNEKNKRGLVVDKGEWVMIQDNSLRFEVNEKCFADKMKEMYSNEELRKECRKNCLKFAEQYTWDKVVKQWNVLLEEFVTIK